MWTYVGMLEVRYCCSYIKVIPHTSSINKKSFGINANFVFSERFKKNSQFKTPLTLKISRSR